MDIFERASRAKLRFDTDIGELTTEQLWDLPLINAKSNADLDRVAREVSRELKALGEESFVELKPDPRKGELELKLEIVKHVIADKMEAAERAKKAAETRERKKKLTEALAAKENQELAGMSREQILAEIEKIGDAA